jgi:hypothetical protein
METTQIISFVGIGVSLLASGGGWVYGLSLARRRDFISTITAERVKWLESLRQNVSKYTGKVHSFWHLNNSGNPADKAEAQRLLTEVDVLSNVIRLQLNPNDSPDREIELLLSSTIPDVAALQTYDPLKIHLDNLVRLTQTLLKKEWERVKQECKKGKLVVAKGP